METVGGYFTPLKEVPTNSLFIRSLVTIEDEDYYSHFGVSISSKLRALRDNLSGYPVS
ncbi:MAG: transglycosylase domain-containing protein [Candidatus Peribacteria bacterium]|nr:MAG: transglycosylase domain-containing protein [Candidatus Peribacteria bacterium]